MSKPHIWLRAETKPLEERCALSPKNARKLIDHGFKLTVERSSQSIFDDQEFEGLGCECVAENSWQDQAPKDAYILGLKELPEATTPLAHRHIYFAHAYKEQVGWKDVLGRFNAGGGALFDLEYLTNENGRRVAAFGFWAGFAGAAVAIQAWCAQHDNRVLQNLSSYKNQQAMIDDLRHTLDGKQPRIIVIGAHGRCGQGVRSVADKLGLEVICWDMEETKVGGPFPEIAEHDIFVNCVFVNSKIPPFLTRQTLAADQRKLSVICDVSCDPTSDFNPLPFYTECSDFVNPCMRIIDGDKPLDLIAIDHLPSLLPAESSDDFSSQLLPSLLDIQDDTLGVWGRAGDLFTHKSNSIK
ncbi:MAG: saccharopine dehydrogenase [Akkermansiaceae bacterium]